MKTNNSVGCRGLLAAPRATRRSNGASSLRAFGFGLFVGLCLLCASQQPAAAQFAIGQNFSATTFGQSGFIPPDTMGAVGPNDITVLINGRFSVYDRSGVLQKSRSLNRFWIDAGVIPAGPFAFDPRIIYDKFSNRWFATSVDNKEAANNYLVAVSDSSDPKGGWTGFAIDSDGNDLRWADYPMLGINQDVVTITANMFSINSGSQRTGILIIPKSDLTQAVPTVANATKFNQSTINTGFSPQPIFDYDNGNLPLPVLSSFFKNDGLLKKWEIEGTANAPTLNTTGGIISVAQRSAPPDIDQPGFKVDIDAFDFRFSGNVIMQQIPGRADPSIWGVQGVSIAGRAAVEWYEIDSVSDAVLQSGTISDPSLGFNFPSIAVNDFGDIVIGFSGGDPNTFMSTYAAVGQTAAGVTTFDLPVQTKAGVADYQFLDGIGRNRWGDYSATVVDPIDERSFWTFQEFVNATDSWQIQITQILIDGPFLLGDISSDGKVDIGDFTLWADAFGNTGMGLSEDLSNDGQVDIGDFTLWADHFGETLGVSSGQGTAAIPEPSSLTLLGIGLLALAAIGCRRRRAA